jgi:hypothetical protein
MTDRATTLPLVAITIGLWFNALVTIVKPAYADDEAYYLTRIGYEIVSIAHGICSKLTLCG